MDTLSGYLRSKLSGAELTVQEIPDCSPLRLALMNPDFPQSKLSKEEQYHLLSEPLYWIFCWPAGVGLAQRILANPQLVRGQTVLDFGAGSGLVAAAAALAGAQKVHVLDSDPWALKAASVNGEINGVELHVMEQLPTDFHVDLLVASDVLYDRDNHSLLQIFPQWADRILLADCRPAPQRPPEYHLWGRFAGAPVPDFDDFDEFSHYEIWSSGFFPDPEVA